MEGGPALHAGYDSLAFMAEQVSHHPPGKIEHMLTQELKANNYCINFSKRNGNMTVSIQLLR